jgi:hypothetical protein
MAIRNQHSTPQFSIMHAPRIPHRNVRETKFQDSLVVTIDDDVDTHPMARIARQASQRKRDTACMQRF